MASFLTGVLCVDDYLTLGAFRCLCDATAFPEGRVRRPRLGLAFAMALIPLHNPISWYRMDKVTHRCRGAKSFRLARSGG